jgi:protoporphyrinogen oxidase
MSYVGSASVPPKDQTTSRAGSSRASAGGSTTTSSRPTTRSSGACPVNKLPADFAAQRIKNLSLSNAVINALLPRERNQKDITSLIEEFQYPKLGPGMMWERCRDLVEAGLQGRS